MVVGGGVRAGFHRPPHDHAPVAREHPAGDLIGDLLLGQVLQRLEPLDHRHGVLLSLASGAYRRARRRTMAAEDPMARLKIGFIPIEGGHYYKDALEEVTRAEELGFDSVWMEEHHAVTNHYWPSPLTVLAGFATRTSRMTLGTDIVVAAFHHPVRLAEDVAMLDVMSNGRVVLGIAIGYKPDEFALYGVDLEKRGARFEEQLAIMTGLWTQEKVSFKGTYYTVEGRIEPKPVAKPHPPLWIGGWGDITLRRAATLADNWIPGPTADLARLLKGKKQFLADRAAAGKTAPITEWPLTRDLIIADTDKKARELAEEHIMVAYRKEYAGGWRHPFIDASIATDLDKLMEDRFLIGGPDQVIPKIRKLIDEYGMTHLICRTFFPGMPHAHIMRELDLLAREVMPAFR
ncbi:MAG: LLM class flavin-dependent oxidoreductase [Candidatus Rokubacteria bacterium]|nr:LLM class flavin-dependent oxidoreductase [Candidatus Rokubacteria bacterium]